MGAHNRDVGTLNGWANERLVDTMEKWTEVWARGSKRGLNVTLRGRLRAKPTLKGPHTQNDSSSERVGWGATR